MPDDRPEPVRADVVPPAGPERRPRTRPALRRGDDSQGMTVGAGFVACLVGVTAAFVLSIIAAVRTSGWTSAAGIVAAVLLGLWLLWTATVLAFLGVVVWLVQHVLGRAER